MWERDVLDVPMIICIPRSGWKDWRYHIAEKSPAVQPMRQRNVFRDARFQVGGEDQKGGDESDGGGDGGDEDDGEDFWHGEGTLVFVELHF